MRGHLAAPFATIADYSGAMTPSCSRSIWVVGGGFTGLATAILLQQMGYSICLYEKSSHLGGIMRDEYVNGAPRMRGCHILHQDVATQLLEPWNLVTLLEARRNSVSSSTKIRQQEYWLSGCEGPLIDYVPTENDALAFPASGAPESVQSRIDRYPSEIRSHLRDLCDVIGLDVVHTWSPSLQALQMNRFFPMHADMEELKKLKSDSPVIDNLFGLVGLSDRTVFLPTDGYTNLFAEMQNMMQATGICLHLNERVRPAKEDEDLVFYNSNGQRSEIGGVWCASPTVLQASLDKGNSLDNSPMTHEFWHIKVRQPLEATMSYIQYFGHPHAIVRATTYAYGGTQHAVIERVSKRGQTTSPSEHDLMQCVVDLDLEPIEIEGGSKTATYPVVSINDFLRLSALEQGLRGVDWVHGAWLNFGRTAKIQAISKSLQEWAHERWSGKLQGTAT